MIFETICHSYWSRYSLINLLAITVQYDPIVMLASNYSYHYGDY